MNNRLNNLIFFSSLCATFAFDIFCFSFFEKHLIDALLCLFFLSLYYEHSLPRLLIIAVCISIKSSLQYGQFGIQLIYLIPCMVLGFQAQELLYITSLQPYILLILGVLTESYFIEPYIVNFPANSYTKIKIIANIIVMFSISLILYTQGKLGNRWKFKRLLEESPDS